MSTPEPRPAKPQRVLACVLCQQRKIKCSRKFPCSSCVKTGVQCIPAALLPRQRRRRFPERDLLDRLRHYEDLLRHNNVEFEPLHSSGPKNAQKSSNHSSPQEWPRSSGPATMPSPGESSGASETVFETKSFWKVMNQIDDPNATDDSGAESDSDADIRTLIRPSKVKKNWERFKVEDDLLFGWCKSDIPLSTLHPEQVQVFKLWQIYLQNVNPVLKITHTPTLQPRLIDAAGNLANVDPILEALMFSIYCVAVHSMEEEQCQKSFSSGKRDLLNIYQAGCQQALLNCKFLRSDSRECLTALYLYLISARPRADPRALATVSGLAIRIAQRIGIHEEFENSKCTPFEGELRRRLWWSLVAFDGRMAELGQIRDTITGPTWECALPLNVDDSDLQPQMKVVPTVHGKCTEALFAVVSSELHQYIRHSKPHLEFKNPVLSAAVRPVYPDLASASQAIEDRYLQFCNLENPVHYLALWSARVAIAKQQVVEFYARSLNTPLPISGSERDEAITYCMRILECDTKLVTSPLTKGYWWFMQHRFPFPAYVHIIQDMRRRPLMSHMAEAWKAMSDNYAVRFADARSEMNTFILTVAKHILQAWAACEPVWQGDVPAMVIDVRQRMQVDSTPAKPVDPSTRPDFDMLIGTSSVPYSQDLNVFEPMIFGEQGMSIDMNEMGFSSMDWTFMQGYKW